MLNKEGEFKGPRGRSSSLIAVILLLMTSITFPDALSGRASSPLSAAISGSISHIWANTGEDKVTRDELRATSDPDAVFNSVWDGTTISLFGARNEVVAFNLIIEAPYSDVTGVTVALTSLNGPGNSSITTTTAAGDTVFNYLGRTAQKRICGPIPRPGSTGSTKRPLLLPPTTSSISSTSPAITLRRSSGPDGWTAIRVLEGE